MLTQDHTKILIHLQADHMFLTMSPASEVNNLINFLLKITSFSLPYVNNTKLIYLILCILFHSLQSIVLPSIKIAFSSLPMNYSNIKILDVILPKILSSTTSISFSRQEISYRLKFGTDHFLLFKITGKAIRRGIQCNEKDGAWRVHNFAQQHYTFTIQDNCCSWLETTIACPLRQAPLLCCGQGLELVMTNILHISDSLTCRISNVLGKKFLQHTDFFYYTKERVNTFAEVCTLRIWSWWHVSVIVSLGNGVRKVWNVKRGRRNEFWNGECQTQQHQLFSYWDNKEVYIN